MCPVRPTNSSPPPWQVLVLVAHHLDPKTLATASCVSKSWSISISSDHVWEPICSTHFPSLSNLRAAAATTTIPYHRLFAIGHKSTQRRLRPPQKPNLSPKNITFAIDIHHRDSPAATLVVPGDELVIDSSGLFRFDIDVRMNKKFVFDGLGGFKVTWNVVLKGFEAVFTMMDCEGKGSFVSGSDGWFSEELPSPGCCTSGVTSGLVAELRLGLRERVVEKVSLGVLSIVSWRYVCVDDAFRYLQHFLVVPCEL